MTDDLTHYMEATERMRQRAERAEAERDRWFSALEAIADVLLGDAIGGPSHVELVDLVRKVKAERDRLRAVVDAARRMHGLIRGDHVIGDDECAMAVDAIVDAVDQLDGSEDMGR